MSTKVLVVAICDYVAEPLGGEVVLLHNLLKEAKDEQLEYYLSGITFNNEAIGAWSIKKIGTTTYPWFPLCRIIKEKEKTLIPFRLRVVAGLKRYYKQLNFNQYDYIYIHSAELILGLNNCSVPIIYHVHGDPSQTLKISRFPLFRASPFSKSYNKIIDLAMKRATGIIWAANTSQKLFLEKHSWMEEIVKKKSCTIHSSFDSDLGASPVLFNFEKDKVYLITVGRLSKVKHIDFIIGVFQELRAQRENLELLICGDGEEKSYLKRLTEEKHLKQCIHFLGNVSHTKLAAYLQSASLFLFASENEAMSLVVLESLYMGTPVVTTDVGDLHMVVKNGETGYIVDGYDASAFKKRIIDCLNHGREYYMENCQKAAESFSPSKMNKKIRGYFLNQQRGKYNNDF